MKLRHQVMLLLVIPIACQLGTTGLLIHSLARVDETARKETTAKKVVGQCQEIHGLVGQAVLEITAPGLVGTRGQARSGAIADELTSKTSQLRELVGDDQQALKMVDKFQRDCKGYLDNWEDITHAFKLNESRGVLSQFFSIHDYVESMKVQLDRLTADLHQLTDLYGSVAKEFQPEAIQARSQLRFAIIAAVTFNLLLVLAMAILFNRKTLTRLKVLMRNMQAFSRGEKEFQRLVGTDELAELDLAFKNMADERNRLDEIRKSIMAMVAHDLKSPLSSVKLTVELILDVHGESLTAAVKKYLERMDSQLQRLSRMARTLLDVEKIEGGNLEVNLSEHSCADIAGPAVSAVSALADQKKIEIQPRYEGQSVLLCDDDRTIQVLVNLLSNAIKFAPEKSAITLRSDVTANNTFRFEVIDQGPGVPAEKINSLFVKFHQLDQPSEVKKEGSGLGLYICKMLVGAQGGKVGYTSPGEKGSCFWFELPLTATKA